MKIKPITEDIYHVFDTDKEDGFIEGYVAARHASATAAALLEVEAEVIAEHEGVRAVRVDGAESGVEAEVFVATRQYGADSVHAYSAHTRLCEAVSHVVDTYTLPPSDDIEEWEHRQPNQHRHERWRYSVVRSGDSPVNYYIHRFQP